MVSEQPKSVSGLNVSTVFACCARVIRAAKAELFGATLWKQGEESMQSLRFHGGLRAQFYRGSRPCLFEAGSVPACITKFCAQKSKENNQCIVCVFTARGAHIPSSFETRRTINAFEFNGCSRS